MKCSVCGGSVRSSNSLGICQKTEACRLAYAARHYQANRDKRLAQTTARHVERDSLHPLYPAWQGMKTRTGNPSHVRYARYGGRGIKVCPEWESSFPEFERYINETLGPRPEGCSLDRMDNDGNYEPGNMRWATVKEQNNNRSCGSTKL